MRVLLFALFGGLAITTTSAAQTFKAAPGLDQISMDLDTQSGNFSNWKSDNLCGFSGLRAALTMPRLGKDEDFLPSTQVIVKHDKEGIGVRFSSLDRTNSLTGTFVHVLGAQDDAKPLTKAFDAEKTIDIAIDWSIDGTVTVKVGQESQTMRLAGSVDHLEISNSTSEVIVSRLQLGTTGTSTTCAAVR